MTAPSLNIVLYEPDIPFDTGNVGRTCVATNSTLHLVGRLGFSIDAAQVKRAGLDYWEKVKLVRHADWEAFLKSVPPEAPLFFFSKKAITNYWSAEYVPGSYLIFGCETKGLPDSIMSRYAASLYRIPIEPDSVRSLNLSVAAGVVTYEALRQIASRSVPAR